MGFSLTKTRSTGSLRVVKINQGHLHSDCAGNHVSTTKYNAFTYLPSCLFEQYRRIANIYFTAVAALSVAPFSPLNPLTTFTPLVLVLGVSMVREVIEDFRRYQADRIVNATVVQAFDTTSTTFKSKPWRDVKVGDILQVQKDTFFPADLLLLSSSDDEGICFVETINLDGESNLKYKHAPQQTSSLSSDQLNSFRAEVQCEQPNPSLYTFTGNLVLGEGGDSLTVPLSPASILLRGSSLRNTKQVLGAVIFAGHDSKVMMNAALPPSKRSLVEKQMDHLIIFMFCLLLTMCVIGATYFAIWTKRISPRMWYLRPDDTSADFNPSKPVPVGLLSFVTSFVLYGYLLPISLYVSLEIVKVVQSAAFINQDREMYDAETDTPARARTSNLNEELGMVHTLLSDKTGTLTCNKMEFFKMSIAGVSYGQGVTEIQKSNTGRMPKTLEAEVDANAASWREAGFNFFDGRVMEGAWAQRPDADLIRQFVTVLAVCHTVQVAGPDDPHKVRYEAESPDEAALVVAAKVLGFFFFRRTHTSVLLRQTAGPTPSDAEYEILNILEFDSTRKRMSVICRSPEGALLLLCKGADTVIYERLAAGNPINERIRGVTLEHMEGYGSAGLRTLCLAYAQLDEQQYDQWQARYWEAKAALEGREARLAAVAEEIEGNLTLLGCTAIEDKLQVGVPDTIHRLLRAGIRIWVLTGDQQETAINIGFACSLLRDDIAQHIINIGSQADASCTAEQAFADAHAEVKTSLEQVSKQVSAAASARQPEQALIIDGQALQHALADDLKHLLLQVGDRCSAVVCCRVSPKQKALVAALVKSSGVVTLAIGDGANDVGMIQEANIGVGISGQEGMQAVMSSDFAIARFSFLETLLLVHGRWSYLRISRMVLYFFYKNIYFGLTIFFYNSIAAFSGEILYNDFYMSMYNVVFTVLPPLLLGTLDQDVSKHSSRQHPGLYKHGILNEGFSLGRRSLWLVNGAAQAGIAFAMVICATALRADRAGAQVVGHWQAGAALFTAVVLTVHLELAALLRFWTWAHLALLLLGIAVWVLFLLVYGWLPLRISNNLYAMLTQLLAPSPAFWLTILVVPVACVLPGFALRELRRQLRPSDGEIVAEIEKGAASSRGIVPVDPEAADGGGRRQSRTSRTPRLTRNSGFVPPDAPGSQGFFTPSDVVRQSNEALAVRSSVQRNPVVARLEEATIRDPFRHRTSSINLRASSASPRAYTPRSNALTQLEGWTPTPVGEIAHSQLAEPSPQAPPATTSDDSQPKGQRASVPGRPSCVWPSTRGTSGSWK